MFLQAEDAEYFGAIATSERSGSDGGYVDYISNTNAWITWTYNAAQDGSHPVYFRYALGTGGTNQRTMALEVNGVIVDNALSFPATGAFENWANLSLNLDLTEGTNTIRLIAVGQNGPNIDGLNIDPPVNTSTVLQAENAVLSGAVVASNFSGAEGGAFVDYVNATGDSITWTYNAGEDATYPISLRYALAGSSPRVMALEVNGKIVDPTLVFDATGAFTNWADVSLNVALNEGANTIRLIATGQSGPNVDSLKIDAPIQTAVTLQAESAVLSGAVVASNFSGAEGGAFVDYVNASGDSITWTFSAAENGTYPVSLRYALAGSSSRTMAIEVNGQIVSTGVAFAATGSFENWSNLDLDLSLKSGTNTIRLIAIGQSGPNVDSITIDEPIPSPSATPATLQAETATISGAIVAANHAGAEGGAFVDYVNASGDSITWSFTADDSGTYPISLRYALAGSSPRSMALEINGVLVTNNLSFAATGSFSVWTDVALSVHLDEGVNTIRLIANGQSGPNIDSLTIDNPTSIDPDVTVLTLQAETAHIVGATIETNGAGAESGAFVDYKNASGDSITWTFESDHDGSFPISLRYALAGNPTRFMALEVNGVVVNNAVGFAATGSNSNWGTVDLNVNLNEGTNTVKLIATGQSGPNVDSLSITGLSHDGPEWREFMDAINVLEVSETGVPLDSSFSIGIRISALGQELDSATVNADTVRLINTFNDTEVPISINTTGGADSLSITPMASLQPNVSHVLVINGVKSLNGEDYPAIARAFTTGTTSLETPPEGVAFNKQVISTGDPIASLTFDADYTHLYGTTMTGSIIRWDVNADGTLSNKHEFVVEAGRTLIGITIDPTNPDRIWISNNQGYPTDYADEFSSKITYIDITDTTNFTGTVTDYVVGLPRSSHDHLTNSLAFGPDGMLYFNQGSLTAMGDTDNAWGQRAETPLAAAVLRLDTSIDVSAGPIDVDTSAGYDPFAPDAPLTIYGSGIRNSYDLLFHSNGSLYVANNGSAAGGNIPDDPNTPQNEAIVDGAAESDYLFNIVEGGYYGHPNPSIDKYISYGGNPTDGIDPAEVRGYAEGTMPDEDWQGFAYDFGISRSPNGMAEYSGGFEGLIDGSILVTEYSFGDRIVGLKVNEAGEVVDHFVLATGFNNPLDVAVNALTGQVYVTNFGGELSFTDDQIVLLTPLD